MSAASTDVKVSSVLDRGRCNGEHRAASHYDLHYYVKHFQPRIQAAVMQRMHAIREFFDESDRILYFGCSDGSLLAALPGRAKAGVEIIQFSRNLALEQGFDVRSSAADFQGKRFTKIVFCHCLEHVPNPSSTLEQLHPLLEDGGQLILNLPMNDCRDRHQRSWRSSDINKHLYAWTPLTLGNLLSVSGFNPLIVRVHKYLYPSRPAWLATLGNRAPQLYHSFAYLYGRICPIHQLVAVAERNT